MLPGYRDYISISITSYCSKVITSCQVPDYFMLLVCYYIIIQATWSRLHHADYYTITMYRYPLLHIITKPLLPDFYVLFPCYYSIIASVLFHYYLITKYVCPLLQIITRSLLHHYSILLSCYYTLFSYNYSITVWLLQSDSSLLHHY